jgi:hypothetical protein
MVTSISVVMMGEAGCQHQAISGVGDIERANQSPNNVGRDAATMRVLVITLLSPVVLLLSTAAAKADGHWFDMSDPNCQITWHANNEIDYKNCKRWRYVAFFENSGGGWHRFYTADGTLCHATTIRIGNRFTITGEGDHACLNFTLQSQ